MLTPESAEVQSESIPTYIPTRRQSQSAADFIRQPVDGTTLKTTLLSAIRTMAPTLLALSFAGVAHAQGTMDFSGATTLMTTFKTFAIYAGAVTRLIGTVARCRVWAMPSNARCLSPSIARSVRMASHWTSTSTSDSIRWARPSGNQGRSRILPGFRRCRRHRRYRRPCANRQ